MSAVQSGPIKNANATPVFTEEETLSISLQSLQADTESTVLKGSDDENETFEEDQYIENETSTMGEGFQEGALVAAKMQHHGSFFSIENRSQRISLLGHGPHGKKVVEMILQEEGEHGIVRFCQRWRAVFVESLKPTHLPHGWDILHRYPPTVTYFCENNLVTCYNICGCCLRNQLQR
jgi:cation-transporting P-type ATPase D